MTAVQQNKTEKRDQDQEKKSSSTSSSTSSSDEKDNVLQNVKIRQETLQTMQTLKNREQAKNATNNTGKHLVGAPLSRETLTQQIESTLRQKHEEEIKNLKIQFDKEREKFESEKEQQEKVLRDMFHAEMDALKSRFDIHFTPGQLTPGHLAPRTILPNCT